MLPALLLSASAAFAAKWELSHQVAVTWFPEGLRYAGRAEYRMPLWNRPGVLFSDTYVAPGVVLEVTPAYVRGGARLHWAPIAVFELELEGVANAYFGTFSGVTDFEAPDADFSADALDAAAEAGRRHAGWGAKGTATATLQARAGPVIVALPQEFTYFHQEIPDGATGDWWYEPQYDALMAWDDGLMVNSGVLFVELRGGKGADKRFHWVGAKADHQVVFGTQDRQIKVGPMYVGHPWNGKAAPTLVFFAQAWVASPIHPILPPYLAAAAIW
jgi:hypothetical protein